MIYLIMKMFIYLAVALLGGFGAGWLTRNLMAGKREEDLQRTLSETKARVPQFESLMRSRDDQLKRLRQEGKDKDVRIGELHDEMGAQEKLFKEKDRDLRAAHNRLAAVDPDDREELADTLSEVDMTGGQPLDHAGLETSETSETSDGSVDELVIKVRRLESEVKRLRQQEHDLQSQLHTAAPSSAMEEVLRSEVQDLESRLRQTQAEHERLTKALEQETRKVLELQRERDLQNKSLQVLHQQLDLARDGDQQTANG